MIFLPRADGVRDGHDTSCPYKSFCFRRGYAASGAHSREASKM